ncbi:hypothetical protein K502DRAFT_346711 [Neoconidiobolus thromboides FSU 785]|nr:hypothetical protein K502DRAFT_346711 [Neoconidiobolus thromboides FSU 785]
MQSFSALSIISMFLVAASAVINSFLIYFASRIKPITSDIVVVITLASIELVFPIVKITNIVYQVTTGVNIIHDSLGCQINGSFLNILYFLEIMFAFYLAHERLSKVRGKPITKYFNIPFFIIVLGFIILTIWVGSIGEMSPYPADLTCFADPYKSPVALITFLYFVVFCYIATILIVYCYLKLSREVLKAYDFVDLELRVAQGAVSDTKSRSWNYRFASIKIYIIVAVYCSLMLISISFLTATPFVPKTNIELIKFRIYADVVTILFFLIGLTSNSVLLMLLHTGVNREMNAFFDRLRKKRIN